MSVAAHRSVSDARRDAAESSLILDAQDLASKWGFDDGGAVLYWWSDNADATVDFEFHPPSFFSSPSSSSDR